MNLYAKQKYYMYLLCKYKEQVELDIGTEIPAFPKLICVCTFTDVNINLFLKYGTYYISYVYLDKLRKNYLSNR